MSLDEEELVTPTRTAPLTSWLALLVLSALAACDQPRPDCVISPANFATKLIERGRVESVPGACALFGPGGFNADPEITTSPYYTRDKKGQPNFKEGSLALESVEMTALLETAQGYGVENMVADPLYSLGSFNVSAPDGDDLCTAPVMSTAHLVLPALPPVADDPSTPDDDETFAGQDPVDITLSWSNVAVYVTAASYGIQLQGDIADTRRTPDGSTCTVNYRALALSPAVPCALTDADGNAMMAPDGTFMPDPEQCNPEANPAAGRFVGSGISPSSNFYCDTSTGFCMLAGESVPSLR